MEGLVLDDCLQQLMKVYAFSEQQHVYNAIDSHAHILKLFFEQRALERLEFIDEIRTECLSAVGFEPTGRITFE